MRLATFSYHGHVRPGAVRQDLIIPLDAIGPDLLTCIEAGPQALVQARPLVEAAAGALPLSQVTLLAPIPAPRRNIMCLGQNYLEHAKESARTRNIPFKQPSRPTFFTKATTTVTGPFADIAIDSQISPRMDWEGELGIVIGKAGKNIAREDATDYILGYTVINDMTARDLQDGFGGQFFKGKSLDGTCPMGPWIVTPDEVPDPENLPVISRVNGVVKQESTTAEFIFKIADMIYWLSLGMTLLPGDIISTGTPSGVGFARTPPEYLHPGDLLETEIKGIGLLRNRIIGS